MSELQCCGQCECCDTWRAARDIAYADHEAAVARVGKRLADQLEKVAHLAAQVESLQHGQDEICVMMGGGAQRHEIKARVEILMDAIESAQDALPEGYRVDAEHNLAECIELLALGRADLKASADRQRAAVARVEAENIANRERGNIHAETITSLQAALDAALAQHAQSVSSMGATIAKLRAALEASRRPNHEDDCDRGWRTEHMRCTCGADAHNARIEEALKA